MPPSNPNAISLGATHAQVQAIIEALRAIIHALPEGQRRELDKAISNISIQGKDPAFGDVINKMLSATLGR